MHDAAEARRAPTGIELQEVGLWRRVRLRAAHQPLHRHQADVRVGVGKGVVGLLQADLQPGRGWQSLHHTGALDRHHLLPPAANNVQVCPGPPVLAAGRDEVRSEEGGGRAEALGHDAFVVQHKLALVGQRDGGEDDFAVWAGRNCGLERGFGVEGNG